MGCIVCIEEATNEKRKKKLLGYLYLFVSFDDCISNYYVNSSPPVEGWKDFKKNSIRNYSFVDDVNLDRITPVDFRISYTLNRKITQEEVDSVFSWTTKYIHRKRYLAI